MKLAEAVDCFVIEQQLRGNTDKTVKGYKWFLKKFNEYLEKQDVSSIADLTIEHINRYQIYLNGKFSERGHEKEAKLKKRSIQTYIRHIKVFMSYCFEQGYVPIDISKKIRIPKAETPMIKILMDDEVDAILVTFDKCDPVMGLRNTAIVYLLLDCGLRLSEVTKIKRDDLNFEKGYLFVNGKGRKERVVPMGAKLRNVLVKYLAERDKDTFQTYKDYMFLTESGTPITEATLSQLMKRLKKETGVKRIHAHLFRHTFATNYLIYGLGDVYELSRLLGHSDIKITEKYLQLANYYIIMLRRERVTYLDAIKK